MRSKRTGFVTLAATALGLLLATRTDAAVIHVTSVESKISETGGCSLQEAIQSANFDANVAIDVVLPDGTDHFVTTQCEPGSGDDTIVLPTGLDLFIPRAVFDAHNPAGPTATPLVFTNITIEGNGATLQSHGPVSPMGAAVEVLTRAFAVGTATVNFYSNGVIVRTVSGTGSLTLRNLSIKGFTARGGDGGVLAGGWAGSGGGGGGMGAGGAVYVFGSGELVIENSTLVGNQAIGGDGTSYGNAGGGGMGGHGGASTDLYRMGGGGGGSGGNGSDDSGGTGGFGGGSYSSATGHSVGVPCGGAGGPLGDFTNNDGHDATCPGGGGGGAGAKTDPLFPGTIYGGNGAYGGGGGGSPDQGGHGGFGAHIHGSGSNWL